ncbi:helix-turn-helix domain-containing protein [Trujillonella humicola]|uniref:helix-turn-helix domain-containing protein n=1 Tax=Trujillonella humicola TaxID=3383699 RepID=UPI00390596A0
MLLFDTAPLPPGERAEAFRAVMQEAAAPCRIEHREEPDLMQARISAWSYGRAALVSTDASRFGLVRTARHVRADGEPVVSLSYQRRGRGEFGQREHRQVVQGRDLLLVDTTAPYTFACATGGGNRALQLSLDVLGLPGDLVRRAAPRLRASPLHDLVRTHLEWLADAAPELADDPGAAALGTATVELVRALVVSAAGDDPRRAQVREETLLSRVRAHVRQNLADPGLTPRSIAAAHNVSVRQLYRACAEAGWSLEQWVIDQRLEDARVRLTTPAGLRRPIGATARACGFADASHFTRRFRRAYGMTPREWQRAATSGAPGPQG